MRKNITTHTHTPLTHKVKKGKCCETFSFDWMKDAAEYSSEVAWLNKPYWNNQGSAEEFQKGKSETRVPLWENTWKVKDKDIGGLESPPPDIPKIGVRVQDGLWAKGQSASAVVLKTFKKLSSERVQQVPIYWRIIPFDTKNSFRASAVSADILANYTFYQRSPHRSGL